MTGFVFWVLNYRQCRQAHCVNIQRARRHQGHWLTVGVSQAFISGLLILVGITVLAGVAIDVDGIG